MADDPASERSGDGSDAGGNPSERSERVASLAGSVEELDRRLDEMIQDVRERVIQLKRETEAKAPADHDHPEIAGRVDRLDDNVRALGRDYVDVDDDLRDLEERVDAVDERLSAGFSNYEEVLEYLVETTDEFDGRLDTLVRAAVDLRERVERLDAADAERAAVDRLWNEAQKHGVAEARCEDCSETVQLGLLTSPSCPHCGTAFGGVEPKTGFFGSATLQAGAKPALEGDVAGGAEELTDLLASDGEEAPPVDHRADEGKVAGTGAPEATASVDEPVAPADDRDLREHDGVGEIEVDAVSGIGATYSERLAAAGVETVDELATADPERLAGAADVPRDRVEGWVDRARQMSESG